MRICLFILGCLLILSCQDQTTKTCSITKTEEMFNDYIDSLSLIKTTEEIIPLLEEHLKKYPKNVVSINNLGACKYKLYNEISKENRELELEILELFDLVLTYCPTYKASLANSIEWHLDFGEIKESIRLMNQYLTIYPENTAILTRLSSSYFELSDFEKSLDYANRSIEMNDTCEYCYTMKGKSLYQLGKTKEAINELNFSKELRSSYLNNLSLGNCYKTLGKVRLSVEHYRKAIEIDSTQIIPFLALADLYIKNDRQNIACELYDKAFKIDYSKSNTRVSKIIKNEKIRFESLCSQKRR